jgi:hypothetical protein
LANFPHQVALEINILHFPAFLINTKLIHKQMKNQELNQKKRENLPQAAEAYRKRNHSDAEIYKGIA